MTGLVPRSSSSSRNSALSYALSPSIRFAGFTLRIRRSATGQSCASPPVNKMARRRPLASASACIFVLRPPRERPTACFCSPFSARCRAMRFHVRGVDHLCVCGSSVSCKLPEQVFPDATPRPAHKAIIDRCRRSILGRAVAPATTALQDVHNAADDAAVVRPLDAPYIRRQMRFDLSPLLVAQPKQVPAHNPDPLPTTNQDRIVRAEELMSFDPSTHYSWSVSRDSRMHARHPWSEPDCFDGRRARRA